MSKERPIILLTRPQMQSERFAEMCRQLLGAEQQIILSPLMEIEILPISVTWSRYLGLIFTSENGVRAYAQAQVGLDLPAYCVGDRTAKAASEAGLKAHSAKGSADDLIELIKDAGVSGPLLHIRGEHMRGDIAGRLGVPVDEVVAYDQVPKPLNTTALAALVGQKTVILTLFSPRTAELFFNETVRITAPLQVIAISETVKEAVLGSNHAQNAENIAIQIALTPDAAAMLQAIKRYSDA